MAITPSYPKHTWVSKEVIRKDTLNNMEDGIFANNQGVRILEYEVADILDNLAPVESTNVASQGYAINDVIVFGSKLCKVTDVITAGDTLEIGTNLARTTIVELIGG